MKCSVPYFRKILEAIVLVADSAPGYGRPESFIHAVLFLADIFHIRYGCTIANELWERCNNGFYGIRTLQILLASYGEKWGVEHYGYIPTDIFYAAKESMKYIRRYRCYRVKSLRNPITSVFTQEEYDSLYRALTIFRGHHCNEINRFIRTTKIFNNSKNHQLIDLLSYNNNDIFEMIYIDIFFNPEKWHRNKIQSLHQIHPKMRRVKINDIYKNTIEY